MSCDRCNESRVAGNRFCRYCGAPLPNNDIGNLIIIAGCIIAALLSIVILLETFTAVWGISIVWDHLVDYNYTLYIIVPVIVNLFTLSGIPLSIFYIILLIAVITSVILLFKNSCKPILNKDYEEFKNSPLFEMTVLFAALYLIEFVFILVMEAFGVNIDPLPERETWQWMFDLLNASVWEELITRVLFLGLPMFIIFLIKKKDDVPKWKYLLGGCGFNKIALILIIFSAFMFGAGHLNNWGFWKFFTTFLFGIIAGYLFCKFGLYATISMHFLTDYIQSESWLAGSDIMIFTTMVILITSVLSIPYILIYARKGFDYLKYEFRKS